MTHDDGRPCAVLKVGGANLSRPVYLDELSRHVRARSEAGERLVVVHGGGPEIGALHDALAVPFAKRDGLRVTSDAGMDLATMVLCGLVNKRIVARFVTDGLPALGVCGVDLALLRAALLDRARYGRVGGAPEVATERLRGLLAGGLIPVVAPVSLAPDGSPVNVNADDAAQAIAAALAARRLDFVSDVAGVRTGAAPGAVAERLSVADIERLIATGGVTGGMLPKLRSAAGAVQSGVGCVRVGNLSGITRDHATEIVP